MDSKNIKRIIITDLDLHHHGGEADESGEKPDYHYPKRFDKSCGRGDGDQTCYGSGSRSESTGFSNFDNLGDEPADESGCRSDLGIGECENRYFVCRQRTARIKPEPPEAGCGGS